jgi:hypothetical protein
VLNELSTTPLKAHGGLDVYIHIFLTLALAGGESSASRPGRFIKSNGKVHLFYEQAFILPSIGNHKEQKSLVSMFEFPSSILIPKFIENRI